MLPHDPCRAVGLLPHVRRLLDVFDGDVAVACSAQARSWLPSLSAREMVVWPSGRSELAHWCRQTADSRCSWAWSLDSDPDPGLLAAFAWLGTERRIAVDRPEYARMANVHLAPACTDPAAFEAARRGEAATLGLSLGAYARSTPSRGASLLLELPQSLGKRESRRWIDLAAALAATQPLIVGHSTDLPPEIAESLRVLGNRLSLLRITRPDDILRLGGEVRAWIAAIGPASILASQSGCSVLILGKDASPSWEVGPEATPGTSRVVYLGRRNPTPSEVLRAVLDLPASGM